MRRDARISDSRLAMSDKGWIYRYGVYAKEDAAQNVEFVGIAA
jgi:hypothetical protein